MQINISKLYQDHHELSHKQVPSNLDPQTEMDVIKKLSHVAMVADVEVEKVAPHADDIKHCFKTLLTSTRPWGIQYSSHT